MNVGEKISLYKERLQFKNYQEFGKASGVSGNWLLELSKKDKIGIVDFDNVLKLCEYLKISVEQLTKDDFIVNGLKENQDVDKEDLCSKIEVITSMLDGDQEVKLDGRILNEQAKQIFKDSLSVAKQLTRQYI